MISFEPEPYPIIRGYTDLDGDGIENTSVIALILVTTSQPAVAETMRFFG